MPKVLSPTEENYLKTIYKLAEKLDTGAYVNMNAIAKAMNTAGASVTDMVKRLKEKDLIVYTPYKGVQLANGGTEIATQLIRKHRLWEVFLLEKLHFKWDEVHDIAEQLEHIQSLELTERLDHFLDYPQYDPHGDPIPDKYGNLATRKEFFLSDLKEGEIGIIVGVKEHSPEFLQYLELQGLILGAKVHILRIFEYDHSLEIQLNDEKSTAVSHKVSQNLYIKRS